MTQEQINKIREETKAQLIEELHEELHADETKRKPISCTKCAYPQATFYVNNAMAYCDICVDILNIEKV